MAERRVSSIHIGLANIIASTVEGIFSSKDGVGRIGLSDCTKGHRQRRKKAGHPGKT
ncbi:hypothetical protein AU15_15725 [Marinobacter salarius]|uniref:Uncharacterized protein n=1 Tax=Marinobacter salarius TaxID=1420917 RepID=W5YW43_9GAMM|nr:hypothetical protein AU15_15725 [Marinobacter salarius]